MTVAGKLLSLAAVGVFLSASCNGQRSTSPAPPKSACEVLDEDFLKEQISDIMVYEQKKLQQSKIRGIPANPYFFSAVGGNPTSYDENGDEIVRYVKKFEDTSMQNKVEAFVVKATDVKVSGLASFDPIEQDAVVARSDPNLCVKEQELHFHFPSITFKGHFYFDSKELVTNKMVKLDGPVDIKVNDLSATIVFTSRGCGYTNFMGKQVKKVFTTRNVTDFSFDVNKARINMNQLNLYDRAITIALSEKIKTHFLTDPTAFEKDDQTSVKMVMDGLAELIRKGIEEYNNIIFDQDFRGAQSKFVCPNV